jgi:hypothetical protein
MTWFARLLGAATATYSAAVLARPAVLAAPCGLVTRDGSVSPEAGTLTRAVGTRDLASGLAVALAPSGRAMRLALGVRIAMDLGDALVLGAHAPAEKRGKVLRAACLWAGLNALALLRSRR